MSAPLPRPLADYGAVRTDPAARELVVTPHRDARGLTKVLWRDGVAAIAKDDGSRFGHAPAVWADAVVDGRRVGQVARGRADGNELRFKFHPGHPEYRRLVSTPGLSATVVVDRGSGHVLGVTFHGRRKVG